MAAEDTASDPDSAETSDADERTLSIGSPDSSRRKFMVAGAATWASVGLAGCSGGGGDDGNESDDGTGDGSEPEPQPENYVVTDSMRTGSTGVPEGAGGFVGGCAVQRTFAPGMQPVWYVGIYDPSTGENISPDEVDSVVISTDNSTIGDVELAFSEEDGEWHGSTTLPQDIEPATVTYTVEVSTEASTTSVSTLAKEFQVISMNDITSNLVVTDQTYATGEFDSLGGQYSQGCLEQDIFSSATPIAWDVGIWDARTGDMVGTDQIDSAEIQFPDHDFGPVELAFAPSQGDNPDNEWNRTNDEGEISEDHAWNAVWRGLPSGLVPDGQSSYRLDYEVVVTPTSDSENVHPVGVYRNYVTIVPAESGSDSS